MVDRPQPDLDDVYEQNVGDLFDLVARVVVDRGAAGDVMADAIVAVVVGRLGELITPRVEAEGIRRRLLAAVCVAAREPEPTVREVGLPEAPLNLAAPAAGAGLDADLAELVWGAAAGIRREQYLVLDLRHRSRLGVGAVAEVLGVTSTQAANRLRGARDAFRNRFRRDLVRRQRPHCRRLALLVPERGGGVSAEQRVAADRHLRRCRVCRPAGGHVSSPEELIAALAPLALPPSLASRQAAEALAGRRASATRRRSDRTWMRRHRRLAGVVLVAVVAAGGVTAVAVVRGGLPDGQGASETPPAAPAAQPAGTVNVGFTPSSVPQRFTVPCGVTSIRVVAVGGSGGLVAQGGRPGRGAVVAADLPVHQGQVLLIVVGTNGVSASPGAGSGGAGGTGIGFTTAAGIPSGDVLAAGGGGGGGAAPVGSSGTGGAGGDGDSPGEAATGSLGGVGGGAAGDVSGGPGGIGGSGSIAAGKPGGSGGSRGGVAGEPNGGGGGGGHHGGGGGGGGGTAPGITGGGGGGGGGSSYLAPITSNSVRSLDPLRAPRLTITYTSTGCAATP